MSNLAVISAVALLPVNGDHKRVGRRKSSASAAASQFGEMTAYSTSQKIAAILFAAHLKFTFVRVELVLSSVA
jgi:hypothetical protein